MVQIPFSMYFGWITVATIANVSTVLVSVEWGRFGLPESFWTIVILLIGMAIGLAVILPRRDTAYGFVMAWAYAGIVIKHSAAARRNGAYPVVIWTAAVAGAILLLASAIVMIPLKRRGFA